MLNDRMKARIEVAILLLDGEWHDTRYFSTLAGHFIAPATAYRSVPDRDKTDRPSSIESGRQRIIRTILKDWRDEGKIVSRKKDSVRIEWKLKEGNGYKKWLQFEITRMRMELILLENGTL